MSLRAKRPVAKRRKPATGSNRTPAMPRPRRFPRYRSCGPPDLSTKRRRGEPSKVLPPRPPKRSAAVRRSPGCYARTWRRRRPKPTPGRGSVVPPATRPDAQSPPNSAVPFPQKSPWRHPCAGWPSPDAVRRAPAPPARTVDPDSAAASFRPSSRPFCRVPTEPSAGSRHAARRPAGTPAGARHPPPLRPTPCPAPDW